MADRNTTQKNPVTKEVVEKGYPRCKRCSSRMSIVEHNGTQKLWCFNCDAPLLGLK